VYKGSKARGKVQFKEKTPRRFRVEGKALEDKKPRGDGKSRKNAGYRRYGVGENANNDKRGRCGSRGRGSVKS